MDFLPTSTMQFFEQFEDERRVAAVALSDLKTTVVGLSASETEDELKLEFAN